MKKLGFIVGLLTTLNLWANNPSGVYYTSKVYREDGSYLEESLIVINHTSVNVVSVVNEATLSNLLPTKIEGNKIIPLSTDFKSYEYTCNGNKGQMRTNNSGYIIFEKNDKNGINLNLIDDTLGSSFTVELRKATLEDIRRIYSLPVCF